MRIKPKPQFSIIQLDLNGSQHRAVGPVLFEDAEVGDTLHDQLGDSAHILDRIAHDDGGRAARQDIMPRPLIEDPSFRHMYIGDVPITEALRMGQKPPKIVSAFDRVSQG